MIEKQRERENERKGVEKVDFENEKEGVKDDEIEKRKEIKSKIEIKYSSEKTPLKRKFKKR